MTDPKYRRLIYFSSAKGHMGTDALDALLMQCRRNNEKLGLTGLLLYGDGSFMQMLEGSSDAVESVYRNILVDGRHHQLLKIDDGLTEERSFADWSMGYVRLAAGSESLNGFLQLRKDVLQRSSFRENEALTGYMVRTFMDSLRSVR